MLLDPKLLMRLLDQMLMVPFKSYLGYPFAFGLQSRMNVPWTIAVTYAKELFHRQRFKGWKTAGKRVEV
jgi:hypothetical protein